MNAPLCRSSLLPLTVTALLACLSVLPAADVIKADNATALNLTASWVSGTVPTSADVAVWNNTITASRNSSLGADLSLAGIRIGAAGGTLMTISGSNTLTLGASGIDMSAAAVNLSVSSTLALGASGTWNVASGRTLTVSGIVQGSGPLTLTGSGTVALNQAANLYSGGTLLDGGIHVAIGSQSAITSSLGTGSLTVGSGGAQIFNSVTGNRIINNPLTLNGDLTLGSTAVATSNFQLLGGIDVGSGTRTISLINGSAPTASVPGLYINPTGAITGSGRLVIANGNAATTPEVWVRWGTSGTFAMTADLTIGNGVTVFFNASNMFSASTDLTVDAGGILDLSNKGGSAYNQTIQSLSGAGTVTTFKSSGGISAVTIDGGAGTGTSTFSGNITSGTTAGASISITKLGSTTQIFSGSNTYTGATQVNAGTLLINGSSVDAAAVAGNGYGLSGTGHYFVAGGATFGGGGRIEGNNTQTNSNMVLVQSGGILTPGSATAALKLDGVNISGAGSKVLNLASGADIALSLAGDGTSAGQIEMWNYVSGDLLLNANEINLTLEGPLVAGTYNVTIFEFYGNSGTTLTTSGITSGLTIGTVGAGITGASISYNSAGGTISLQYTVVPEPSAVVLAGLGFALVLWRARRRAPLA